jgi:hypothetical protein
VGIEFASAFSLIGHGIKCTALSFIMRANGLLGKLNCSRGVEWRDMILQLFDTISHTSTQKQQTFLDTQQKRLTVNFRGCQPQWCVGVRKKCLIVSTALRIFSTICFTPSDNSIVRSASFSIFLPRQEKATDTILYEFV